jgi:hypothetical protein
MASRLPILGRDLAAAAPMPEERGMRPALLLLGLLLAARPVAAQDLSGTWFGERFFGRVLVQHLSDRDGDGRFSVRFRFFEGCVEVGGQRQTGRWAVAGDEFRTWIETVDDTPRDDLQITYRIEDFTGDRMAYRGPNGTLHRAFRVEEDYVMPPPLGCDAVS